MKVPSQNIERAIQYQEDQKAAKRYRKKNSQKKKDEKKTFLTLPNGTTFMTATINPIQLKVIIYVIKELQPYIRKQIPYVKNFAKSKEKNSLATLNMVQGDLFTEINDNYYCILPKKIFVRAKHYQEFKEDVDALTNLKIIFKKRNPLTEKIETYKTTLFSTYEDDDIPKSRSITVEITKTVLQHLCNISVALTGGAQWDVDYYNNVLWEVILSCRKRYSGLLYLYLCSWRETGGWKIKTEDLKSRLGIGEEQYKRKIDFKRFVLKSSADELKKINLDFTFSIGFEGEYTVFKIIELKNSEEIKANREQIFHLLNTCHLKEHQINDLRSIIDQPENHAKLKVIILGCIEKSLEQKSTKKPINDLGAYTTKTIQNWDRNKKKMKK